jgi:hypothetical protein
MQRYLRLPLSTVAGLVGKRGLDVYGSRKGRPPHPGTIIDALGDCFMSGYKAPLDAEWYNFHNALCRALATFASQAGVVNKLEGGKVRGSKKRPGDVRFSGDAGAHGWNAAHQRELWVDATVVCPLYATYLNAAAAQRGAAAEARALSKRTKYRNDIPGFAHFLALPFETEGFVSADVDLLLHGFAKLKVSRGDPNLSEEEAKRQASAFKAHWLDELAVVHARYLARCIINRASACKDAGNPCFRRASIVDVDAASSLPPPPPPPPPQQQLPGIASAAAAAP